MPRLLLIIVVTWLFSGASQALACPGKLGVSRTITLNTTGGPLHGSVQYKTESLLQDGEVVLTFDDGPLRMKTRKVLAALKDHCTKATFFMVGRMAVADPAMVREVASEGHTIASHTWSHPNLHRVSANRAKGEIELGISAIQHALGKPIAPFFRFPYLADPKSMIAYNQQRDIAVFSIDVDGYDYRTRSGKTVRLAVLRQLKARKKGIILLHDIQISVVRAIAPLLDDLHRNGYKVVHLQAAEGLKTLKPYDRQAEEIHAKRLYSRSVRPINSNGRVTPTRPVKTAQTRLKATLKEKSATRPSEKSQASDDNWKRKILGQSVVE